MPGLSKLLRGFGNMSMLPSQQWPRTLANTQCHAFRNGNAPLMQRAAGTHTWSSLRSPSCLPVVPHLHRWSDVKGIKSSSSSRDAHKKDGITANGISAISTRQSVQCSAAADSSEAGTKQTIFTLPTILTLGRVAAVPAVVAAWFWSSPHATAAVTGLFVVASITDWLDGYLARKMNLSSKFGAFLDPVADKLMVAAALILLCTQPLAAGPLAGNAWLVPASTLVIIGREISMSALREWAATLGSAARDAVAVSAWGKWKTASQMVALTALLMTRDGIPAAAAGLELQLLQLAAAAGPPLLVVSAWLSAHSLGLYLRGLWKFMAE